MAIFQSRVFAALLLISSTASFTALLPRPACRHQCAMQTARALGRSAALAMADEGDETRDEAPAAEPQPEDPPTAEAEPAPVDDDAEDEDDGDLLSTPAFLKQKLKVLEKEMADAEARLEEAKGEAEEVGEEWAQKRARLQGDFDNFRARHVNQTLEAQLDARIKVLTEFLPVLDNFDRARASISPAGDAEDSVNAQYEQLHDALMTSLGDLGMEKIDAVGQEFDYNMHMAIQQMPSDEFEENHVMSELQPGYTCNGKLVRAAYVIVSSG